MKINGIKVYCPINNAKIELGSTLLDDMGQFTKFILWTIGEGYAPDIINEVIELNELILDEEIEYLIKVGLLAMSEETLKLSLQGQRYKILIDRIEETVRNPYQVMINRYSGDISEQSVAPVSKSELISDITRLPVKVSRHFLNNKNFSNSLEWIKLIDSEKFSGLDPQFLESIYTELHIEKEIVYSELEMLDVPNPHDDYYDSKDNSSGIILQREIQDQTFEIVDNRLEKYRNVLPTLNQLLSFDEELVSDRTIEVLEYSIEEMRINKNSYSVTVDTYSGEIVRGIFVSKKYRNLYRVKLGSYKCDFDEQQALKLNGIEDDHYSIGEITVVSKIIDQFVPLSMFNERIIDCE